MNSLLFKNGKTALEFELLQDDYLEEFLRLCWDLIESTSCSKEPLHDLILKYKSWLKLLQNFSNGVMSFEKQKGLLGELLYFKTLLDDLSPTEVLNSWVGPDGADQDFVFNNTWTEVKSVALATEKVHISSLQQLDQEIPGKLLLQFLEKTVDSKNSVNLQDEIEEVRKKLNDSFLIDIFNTKLIKYGYKEEYSDKYKSNCFRFVESYFYRVDSNFPRMTRKNVPIGIVEGQYSISLVAIEQFLEE